MRTGTEYRALMWLVWLLGAVALGRAAAAQDVAEVLAKVREASGVARLGEHPHGVWLEGREGSDKGDRPEAGFRMVVAQGGRFLYSLNLEGMVCTVGFDGRVLWQTLVNEQTRALDLDERMRTWLPLGIMTGAALATGTPLSFRAGPEGAPAGTVVLTFEADEGRTTGRVEINRQTWRAARWTATVDGEPCTWELDGSAAFDGMVFPGIVRSVGTGGTKRITTVRDADPMPADAFRFMPSPPRDMTFDGALGADVEARASKNGHLLVRARINGKDAGWFLFDTGVGLSTISVGAAKELGLRREVEKRVRGVGPGSTAAGVCFPDSLAIGPLTIRAPDFQIMDLGQVELVAGEKIAGMLGYWVLARSVAEVDLAGSTLRLYPPGTRAPVLRGREAPCAFIKFADETPCVPATVEGHAVLVALDSGGAGSLALTARTVDRFKLLEGRATTPGALAGVGGASGVRMGALKAFEMAGRRFDGLGTSFRTGTGHDIAGAYVDGLVGVRVMREFVMVFDYTEGKVWCVPRERREKSEPK